MKIGILGGRQWRFFVKVWIWDNPEAFAEDWFCIRIHNNWSWDRDNKPPLEYEEIVEEIIENDPLPKDLCCEPVQEQKQFTPQVLPTTLCPCESETSSEQEVILKFLKWYDSVLKNPPEDNPDILSFIDNFKKTDYFIQMMKKANLEEELTTPEEKEAIAVKILIKYYTDQLIEGRGKEDIDYIMIQLKEKENQKLPITALSFSGAVSYIISMV